ncbi:hypothetical protein AXG93_509s1310 [Marchantia polymorpha subsp. ruderalis]|uniref:Uncharacterized protein n=1 Tax=Marchantia polymorpha subsp. ruderalis TaxID=1480154 RepID=A0A176W9G7_MARPO|nr:hypothetical protein AXG93_509s1310 [Marchantia polymorpha subsp. ruderalis]
MATANPRAPDGTRSLRVSLAGKGGAQKEWQQAPGGDARERERESVVWCGGKQASKQAAGPAGGGKSVIPRASTGGEQNESAASNRDGQVDSGADGHVAGKGSDQNSEDDWSSGVRGLLARDSPARAICALGSPSACCPPPLFSALASQARQIEAVQLQLKSDGWPGRSNSNE